MRKPIRTPRPQRQSIGLKRTSSAKQVRLGTSVTVGAVRSSLPARPAASAARAVPAPPAFAPDPYVDYGRFLTPEGGILIVYKDIDDRLRHTVWRLTGWTIATGLEALLLFQVLPLKSPWIDGALLLVAALINWLIVAKPVECHRSIEIRPRGMILDGADVFWLKHMEGGWPSFRPDEEGNQVLCGIYGTRFVEYLTIRRFDELDRTPETFAGHLRDAMQQLWMDPHS